MGQVARGGSNRGGHMEEHLSEVGRMVDKGPPFSLVLCGIYTSHLYVSNYKFDVLSCIYHVYQ